MARKGGVRALGKKGKNGASGPKLGSSGGGNSALGDYARLLACPDTGPLVHPLYGGATEGYLIRVRKVINSSDYFAASFAGGTSVNMSCVWCPGDATRPLHVYRNLNDAPSDSLGYTFPNPLQDTGFPINAARCVAAQLEAKYTGREIDRSGLGACGQLVVADLPGASASGVSTVGGWTPGGATVPAAVVAEHVTDHPNHLVVKWRPTSVDELWTTDSVGFEIPQPAGRVQNPSIFTTILGTTDQAATPYSFILTAVYEWKPRQAAGVANVPTVYTSVRATAAQAVQMASRLGIKWATSVMQDAASSLPAVMMAYAGRRAYGPPRIGL